MDRSSAGNVAFATTPFQRRTNRLVIWLSVFLLSACGDNQMAYFNGSDHSQSVSLVREQAYLSGPWQTTLVVAADPLCQRRYPLNSLSADQIRIDVYRPEPGVYILDTGQRWYVTELQNCEFQAYKKPPPVPGELIGGFNVENGTLSFSNAASNRSSVGAATKSQSNIK